MPDGWRCPECGIILAPSVTEHRCDPPSAGVPAVKPDPGKDPDLTAMGVREIQRGIASIEEVRARLDAPSWTVNTTLSLSPAQISTITRQVQAALLEQAKRNPRRPGSAA